MHPRLWGRIKFLDRVILVNERSALEWETERYMPKRAFEYRVFRPKESYQCEYRPEYVKNRSPNSSKLVPSTASSCQTQPRLVGARLNNRA